jgi:hypothetical protein
MFKKKNDRPEDGIDRLGREALRRVGLEPEESEAAASSPFLYAKIRASIEADRNRAAEPFIPLQGIVLAGRRAIPAMTLIALAAVFAVFWLAPAGGTRFGIEQVAQASACSVNTQEVLASSGCTISDEEVFRTVVNQEKRGLKR